MRGCNLTIDRLYTSVGLAHTLSDQGLTPTGTWQSNRKGFPEQLRSARGDDHSSTIWYQIEDHRAVPAEKKLIRLT